jgi:hypothetical protein
MTARKDERIELSASKGALAWVKWAVGILISCGLVGGGIAQDNKLDDRVIKLEETVNNNTIEISGAKIDLKNYSAQLVSMNADIKETRATTQQILLILTKR